MSLDHSPAPKNSGWIWYMSILVVLSVAAAGTMIKYNLDQQLKPEHLEIARKMWIEKGPHDYDMEYVSTVRENAPEKYAVRVRSDKVVSVTLDGRLLEDRLFENYSMLALFSFIQEFLELDAQPGKPRTFTVADFNKENGRLHRYVRRVMGSLERVEIVVSSLTPVTPDDAGKAAPPIKKQEPGKVP